MELEKEKAGHNTKTVLEFIEACCQKDVEKIISFFDESTIYHNLPLEPVVGAAAICEVVQPFYDLTSEMQWVVKQVAETSSGVVLTERLDRFLINECWVELPVMGCFEVDGDKIIAWRDYFDLTQLRDRLPPISE